MKLSCIRSIFLIAVTSFFVACNSTIPSTIDDGKSPAADTNTEDDDSNTSDTDETANQPPVFGFRAVDFQDVPLNFYQDDLTLLLGTGAEVTDPDGDEDIEFIAFIYDDANGDPYRITLKDTRSETPLEDQRNHYDESLGMYYRSWFGFPNSMAFDYWDTSSLTFQAIDSAGNVVSRTYRIKAPNGDYVFPLDATFVYGSNYSGNTSGGLKSIESPSVSNMTRDANRTLTFDYIGNDARIHSITALVIWSDGTDHFSIRYPLNSFALDGTSQTVTIPQETLTFPEGFNETDVTGVRLFSTDDPTQNQPEVSAWWHYESYGNYVQVVDI